MISFLILSLRFCLRSREVVLSDLELNNPGLSKLKSLPKTLKIEGRQGIQRTIKDTVILHILPLFPSLANISK